MDDWSDIEIQAIRFNYNSLATFHNSVQSFFAESADAISLDDDLNSSRKVLEQYKYANTFPDHLRESILLMTFGVLEEWLYLKWSDVGKPDCLDKRKHGLDRYKPFLRNYLKINLGNNIEYGYIKDCQKVRDSLIHCSGRVSLLNKPYEIEAVVKKNVDYFAIENDRLKITFQGLNHFQKTSFYLLHL